MFWLFLLLIPLTIIPLTVLVWIFENSGKVGEKIGRTTGKIWRSIKITFFVFIILLVGIIIFIGKLSLETIKEEQHLEQTKIEKKISK